MRPRRSFTSNHSPAQPGFSRIELLTVMAIVFLLAAQAVPAVVQVKEVARRTQCQNNLKQIGLALHNYQDVYNHLAPGFVMRDWDSTNQQGFGWMSAILPYVDQAPIYNILAPDGGGLIEASKDARRKQALMTRIAAYRCPSDTSPDFNKFRGNWPTSNYSGNAGHRAFPRLITGTATDFWPGQVPTPRENRFERVITGSGIFSVNSNIGFRDVIDGTSNTLLVSERGASSLAGIWAGVTAASHENDCLTDTSHLSRPNRSLSAFSSSHQNSFHVLFCDGSVRRIDDSIDSQPNSDPTKPLGVLQKLGGRNDGQILEF